MLSGGIFVETDIYWGISFFTIFILFGFFIERYLFEILAHCAKKTNWEVDDILIATFRKRMGFWGLLFTIYFFSHYFLKWAEGLEFIRAIIAIIFIFSVACTLSESATALITIYARKTPKVIPSTSIFTNLTNSVLFIFAVIFALQSLGVSITPLLTALGVGGLAVALALQDTLSNFFAGLHLLIARPVRPNDYIRLDSGEEGYVIDITWRNTSIEDLMHNMIIVPNSKMAEARIINYNLPEKYMLIIVALAVDYNSNLERVESIAYETARDVMKKANNEIETAEPLVRFSGFGDNSVEFNVSLSIKQFSSQYFIRHEFIKLLQKRFMLEGIILPESTHTIILKDEKLVKI